MGCASRQEMGQAASCVIDDLLWKLHVNGVDSGPQSEGMPLLPRCTEPLLNYLSRVLFEFHVFVGKCSVLQIIIQMSALYLQHHAAFYSLESCLITSCRHLRSFYDGN